MDITQQFLQIIDTFGISVLDMACIVYLFKQAALLICYIIKKIKGDK